MSWSAVGIFPVSGEVVYSPSVQGRIFRVRSIDQKRFQILVKQAQVIFEQIELFGTQRLSIGPEFTIFIFDQPTFFTERRLSIQSSDLTASTETKSVLMEVLE